MFEKFFKKDKVTIDDIIKTANNKVSLKLNAKSNTLSIGIGETILCYGQNYSTMRAPLRIYLTTGLIIDKIEIEHITGHNKEYRKYLKLIKDIKIGDKFNSKNSILMYNINKICDNYNKFEYMYESDIFNEKLDIDKYFNPKECNTRNIINYILF